MSEGSKGALGSKAALIAYVKEKYAYGTTKEALNHIGAYNIAFFERQEYGSAVPDCTLEAMNDEHLNDTNFWFYREHMRGSGELDVQYEEPPQRVRNVLHYRRDLKFHFLHMSLDQPGMVAYTPSIAYGIADRQVRCKLGGYLAKFFGEYLSAAEIKQIVDGSAALTPEILDSDYIVEAYIKGPYSCMAGDEQDGELDGIHPCSAYETDDWQIAVLKDSEGAITDRALICVHGQKKGCFVRCYGDNGDGLKEKLIEMGYEFASRWPSGARLRYIECSGGIVAPYLDGGRRGVSRKGRFMVIGGDDYTFEYAAGYISMTSLVECASCREEYDADEMTEVHNGDPICRGCLDEYYVEAYVSTGNQMDYAYRDDVIVCESDGDYYLGDNRVLKAHGVHQCEVRGKYYNEDDMVETPDGWVHQNEYVEPVQKDEDTLELPLEAEEERRAA